jgi:hypothetical protein
MLEEINNLREQMKRSIIGQELVIERLLIGLLANGILRGAPTPCIDSLVDEGLKLLNFNVGEGYKIIY